MSAKAKLAKKEGAEEVVALFGQTKVDKYVIKPWTISQFVSLTPLLKHVVSALEEQGINISQTDLQNISLSADLTAADLAKYLTKGIEIVGPVIPQLIAISVRIDLEEAESLDWGLALAISTHIISLNWEHIKNWLGQTQIMGTLGLANPTTMN